MSTRCFEKDASITENGALGAYFDVKKGRFPKDKRVVKSFGTPDFVIYTREHFPQTVSPLVWGSATSIDLV